MASVRGVQRSSEQKEVPLQRFFVPSLQTTLINQLLDTKNLQESFDNILAIKNNLSFEEIAALENALCPTLIKMLLQAVIDDDGKTADLILSYHPEFLLVEPKDYGVKEIDSKCTFQNFLPKTLLVLTQRRCQVEMTRILLSHLHKLTEEDKKSVLNEQWITPPYDEKQQQEKDKKLQQEYITEYFKPLIDTIATNNEVKVTWEENNETKCYEARIANMSEAVQCALEVFRKKLLPNAPIDLDNYVDVQQFLIAAYRALWEVCFNTFHTQEQRDVFAISVIGFILSVQTPELAKVYCQSLYDVVENNHSVGAKAEGLKLYDGRSFYRASRDSHSGQGFDFVCSTGGVVGVDVSRASVSLLKSYVEQTQSNLANLRSKYTRGHDIKCPR